MLRGIVLRKNIFEPKLYVLNKIKGIWWPYVKWGILFVLLHNLFFSIHICDKAGLYSLADMKSSILNIVTTMTGTEQLLCANWFLNALFWGTLIAWTTIKFVRNLYIGGGIIACVCVVFNFTHWHIPFFQISAQAFASALLIVIGHAIAKYRIKPFTHRQIILALIFTFIGSLIWEMAMNMDYYSNFRFVPYIFTAVLATWSFYSLFDRIKDYQAIYVKILSFVGNHTLTILIWHLLSFKLVSLLIIFIYDLPIERLSDFPVIDEYASKGWCLLYFFVAMTVSCGIAYCNKWIKSSWLKL